MSKTIRVRNAPDGVHRMLTARAAAVSMSLSDYVKRDLELTALRPSLEELDGRVATRGASGLRTATLLAAPREVRED